MFLLTVSMLKRQLEDLILEDPSAGDCYVSHILVKNGWFIYVPALINSDLMGKSVFEGELLTENNSPMKLRLPTP